MTKTVKAEPNASSMFHTMRSIGYTVETALADIIDNSISAGSKNIEISFEFEATNSCVAIIDDGNGMTNEELINALRPGSTHPNDERIDTDLGRFGLGLKTASLSQCKSLSVVTKKDDKISFWTWDLDYVKESQEWLLTSEVPNIDHWTSILEKRPHGTAVIWTKLDRLLQDLDSENTSHRSKFFGKMKKCKDHISMVFHRFLEGKAKNYSKISISMNNNTVNPWDPFMTDVKGVDPRPTDMIEPDFSVKGFILPHRSKLLPEEYRYGMSILGSWTDHQGFYVYRNDRILVYGSWLGLFKNERQYDLCRLKIDVTNRSDSTWKIDIKKSTAEVPSIYQERLKTIAKEVRSKGVEVYRKKGKILKRKIKDGKFQPMWNEVIKSNRHYFMINRENTLVKSFISGKNTDLNTLLRFIEESIPVGLIASVEADNEKLIGQPFENKASELFDDFKLLVNIKVDNGTPLEEAIIEVLNIEPFDNFPELAKMIEDD